MQRVASTSLPPRRQGDHNNNGGEPGSPALHMASRIRAEQGPDKAAQYLAAMEPFLAPGERAHIAGVLGLPQLQPQPPQQPYTPPYSQPQPPVPPAQPQGMGGMGPLGPLGNFANMGNMGGLGNIGNIMQMMQLVNGMQGMLPGGGQGGASPLAQMLGGLMGGKK